jgi:hypothetical protein
MRYISHRGNLFGREEQYENSPTHIMKALAMGFEVEIDVWYIAGQWFLGHDKAQYHIPYNFLFMEGLWCHAKNKEAFEKMLENHNIHCFWHESDERILTSRNYVWTYVNKDLINNSVCVLPEISNQEIPNGIAGICSDVIFTYKFNCEE